MQPDSPYRLIEALGSSQVGSVWSAVDAEGRSVTVVMLDASVATDQRWRDAFATAANALAQPQAGGPRFLSADFAASTPWAAFATDGGSGVERVFLALGVEYQPVPPDPHADSAPTTEFQQTGQAPPEPGTPADPGDDDPSAEQTQRFTVPPPVSTNPWAAPPAKAAAPEPAEPPTVQIPTPPAQVSTPPAQTYTPPQQVSTPPAQTYTPPQQVSAPPSETYLPPQQVSTPPVQGYAPPQQVSTPPAQGYTPPQQVSTPPAQGYTPPQQVSTPPAQGYTPPAQSYYPPPEQVSAPPRPMSVPPHPASGPPVSVSGSPHPTSGSPYPISAPPQGPPAGPLPPAGPYGPYFPAASRPPRRRTPLLIGAVVLAVVLLGGGTVIAWRAMSGGSGTPENGPTSAPASAPVLSPSPLTPGLEPPRPGNWPAAWPKFDKASKVQTLTLDGLGFTLTVPSSWDCVAGGSATGFVKYNCGTSLGNSAEIGGELIVRDCPKPCDESQRTTMRGGEEAWGLQWRAAGEYVTLAETLHLNNEQRYGLVLVAYLRSTPGGTVDRQLVLRMAAPQEWVDELRRVANGVRGSAAF